MRSRWTLLLGVLLCALAACGPSDDAADGRDPAPAPTSEPTSGTPSGTPAVSSISVVQVDGPGAGTVWTLDRELDADRPGAEAAFDAAGRPTVQARVGRFEQPAGPRQTPSFRVTVVWDDGARAQSVGGPTVLGADMTAVVVATRKAAEPVRG